MPSFQPVLGLHQLSTVFDIVSITVLIFMALSANERQPISGVRLKCPAIRHPAESVRQLKPCSDPVRYVQSLFQYNACLLTVHSYQQLIGCNNVNLTNTTSYYARYTTSVICNAIIQNSIGPCSLSGPATRPLCAESCVRILGSPANWH